MFKLEKPPMTNDVNKADRQNWRMFFISDLLDLMSLCGCTMKNAIGGGIHLLINAWIGM